jgi:hypothetical protein
MARSSWQPKPDFPAIIFNESGSMGASGRIGKSMDIIMGLTRNNPADYYINSADTGYPRFVSHLNQLWSSTKHRGQPLLPIPTGEDYMNPLALASLIEEYPEGVHLIGDADSITDWVDEALHLLKSMKSSGYMHPVTVYFVRGSVYKEVIESYYENFIKRLPADEGFNVEFYWAIADMDNETYQYAKSKSLPFR